ncbi:MAG: SDR family NAD(P)-dependent oxidoreductase [Elusimicrobiales bacterium]
MKCDNLEPIAIVGIGAVMPGALNKDTFWNNILGMKSSITEVPSSHWDWHVYYDPDPKAPDKTYSKIGGFIKDFKFESVKYRIPPQVAKQMDAVQHLAIETAHMALADGGYDKKVFNRERCAAVIGNAMGGMKNEASLLRIGRYDYYEMLRKSRTFASLGAAGAAVIKELDEVVSSRYLPITEDTMPGELSNVIAGRVANVFDLNGANFSVDAACATSLAAVDQAVNGLRLGNFDMAIAGGVDQMMSASAYVKFCKIGALSADGSFVFDARANGFVMAEGAGLLLLKRFSDAVRDGDKIYALIRAIGASSDGRGKGITAPNPKGQKLAIEKTFAQLDYTPADVGFVEAHGTATRVGDVSEMSALVEVFGKYGIAKGAIGISSIKSQIGHAKAAAGVASLIKAALALHNKTLPPSINFATPNPNIDWNGPFRVITGPEQWQGGKLRRANVSSFGFGGTNFHAALEEYVSGTRLPDYKAAKAAVPAVESSQGRPVSMHTEPQKLQGEAITFSAASKAELVSRLNSFAASLKNTDPYPVIAYAHALNCAPRGDFAVALSAKSAAELKDKISFFVKTAQAGDVWRVPSLHLKMKGIYPFHPATGRAKIGFMFPGQGSQYVDMMKDLASKYQVVQDTFDEADRILKALIGVTITETVWSKPGENADELAKREDAIRQTQMTQPSVLTADIAMMRLLTSFGVKPDIAMGHSLGEYAAAVACGIFTFESGLRAVTNRAKEMSNIQVDDTGKMASVAASCERVEAELKSIKGYVIAANKNCPTQTVISGDSKAVAEAIKLFNALGVQAAEIPVSHAFHSEIIRPGVEPYRKYLGGIPVSSPVIPILSNVTAGYFPPDEPGVRELLLRQITSPVEWMKQLHKMYDSGVRVYVECGPKRVLSALATGTLQDRKDIVVLASNHPKKGGINEFNDLLASLTAAGVAVDWSGADISKGRGAFTPAYAEWAAQTAGINVPPAPPPPAPAAVAHVPANPEPARECAPDKFGFNSNDIAVSGIAAGTPGSWDKVFRDGNIDEILRGQNMIEQLSPEDMRRQIDKNIVSVLKSATGDHRIERLSSIENAIKLAAVRGGFDLEKEFGLPANWVGAMDASFQLALAAGVLALRDAGIPLVQHYRKTSTGGYLPDRWGLPAQMMDDTGVIFASAFPSVNALIDEVSRCLTYTFRKKSSDEIYGFYDALIQRVTDPALRRELSQWFAENYSKTKVSDSEQAYTFNQNFLLRIIPIGHSQLCQWIRARGPATHISAACASTTQAVGIAEDWIRVGRAKRVLVVAADDITNERVRDWLFAGFLSTGAATTKSAVSEAALPFDRRRHGLIVGMGAAALLVEDETETRKRGMKPLARVLSTETANSAFHPTRLDVNHVAQIMDRLVARAEKQRGLSRSEMSRNMLFMSHETYTPARGGSASAEVNALKSTFGADAPNVVVSNVKGFTGHTMGAGLEDVIAVRALNTGTVPPIANYKEPDPELAGITLSKGGEYDLKYAIRLGAGFGSQTAMTLLERTFKKGEARVEYPEKYNGWLKEISGQTLPELEVVNNTLRVKDSGEFLRKGGQPPVVVEAPQAYVDKAVAAARQPAAPAPAAHAPAAPAVYAAAAPVAAAVAAPPSAAPVSAAHGGTEVQAVIIKLITDKTGYPQDMLELDLDMEADLGIDTVKQAELFAAIREHYSIPRKEGVKLKDYPTIRHCINFVLSETGGQPAASAPAAAKPAAPAAVPAAVAQSAPAAVSAAHGEAEAQAVIIKLITDKTGYPQDMLELDLDMEADLGIDTVKQAELFAAIREHYSIPRREGVKLKDYPTIRHCINFVLAETGGKSGASVAAVSAAPAPAAAAKPAVAAPVVAPPAPAAVSGAHGEAEVKAVILKLVTDKTGYPQDMLELDLDMEADLGIDTVKQAELFAAIREHYSIPRREGVKLKDYPTIRHCINFVLGETGGKSGASAPPAPAAPAAPVVPAAPAPAAKPAAPAAATSAPAPKPAQGPAPSPKPFSAAAPARLSDGEVKAAVLKMVAEKTGYPQDMLDLDLDMEADLGIDTVKQAELFAAIREHYSIPRKEGVKLKDYPTIRHCINFVLSESSAPASAPQAAPAAAPQPPKPETGTIRLIPTLVDVPLEAKAGRKLSPKRPVIIMSDNAALTRAFQYELSQLKVPVYVFTSAKSRGKNTATVDWRSLEETEKALRDYASDNPRIQGIVYLLGAGNPRLDKSADPHADLIRYVMPLFHACKIFEGNLADQADADTFISVNITIDGAFGMKAARDFDPFPGALSGAVQCFRKDMKELAKTRTKLLDFEPETAAEEVARATLAEVLEGDDRLAIAMRGGKRQTYHALPVPLDKSIKRFNLDGKTVLVTGGGRGLGALFTKMAAQQHKMRFVVLDIIRHDEQSARWAAMNAEQLAELKNSLWVKMRADKSRKGTPVILEKEFGAVMDAVGLHRHIEEIQKLGSQVEYFNCDLLDLSALNKTMADIKAKFGQIDGAAHFAGLERSKLVNEKTAEEFMRIYDVKAASAMAMLASGAVKEKGFWVFISSIAGKFGNLGQSDYASASDYIAKLAISLSASGIRAYAADMSGYASIGMAVRPGVEAFLKSQGMVFLQPQEGMQTLIDEIIHGDVPEIVLSASLGKLDWDGQVKSPLTGETSGPAPSAPPAASGGMHFVERIAMVEEGRSLLAEKEFSLEKDPYLADHSIDGTPYVPGVMGIETFMEAAAALAGKPSAGLEDVHFSLPIKLLRNRPQGVRVSASKTGAQAEMFIESDFVNPQGEKMGAPRRHFSARTLGAFETVFKDAQRPQPALRPPSADKAAIYKLYFHGPSFQVLESVISVTADSVTARYRRPATPVWPGEVKLCAFPLLIEAAFQACGFRDLTVDNRMALPDYVGKLRVYAQQSDAPETLDVHCRFKGKDQQGKSVYDACVCDKDGNIWIELQDYRMIARS